MHILRLHACAGSLQHVLLSSRHRRCDLVLDQVGLGGRHKVACPLSENVNVSFNFSSAAHDPENTRSSEHNRGIRMLICEADFAHRLHASVYLCSFHGSFLTGPPLTSLVEHLQRLQWAESIACFLETFSLDYFRACVSEPYWTISTRPQIIFLCSLGWLKLQESRQTATTRGSFTHVLISAQGVLQQLSKTND
jgi:hypothetical protein